MKISTKGRYALRLMLDLALHNDGTPVRIKDIAARQNVSDKYLEQIVSMLNRAGYVRSLRGVNGGYLLTKRPEEYTVGMILRLTEGSLAPVSCLEGEENTCNRRAECATVILWEKLYDAICGVVDTYTLQDIVEWHSDKANDYVI